MAHPREFAGIFDAHPELYSDSAREAERDDDVSGSGVFDAEGRNNLHVGDGVFETNFGLPGYAKREDLNGKSEVIDRQTKTPIEVYASGMTRGQQYMPSTAPRYPSPDKGLFWSDPQWGMNQDPGGVPAADISFDTDMRVQRLSGLGSFGLGAMPSWASTSNVVFMAAVGLLFGVVAKMVADESKGSAYLAMRQHVPNTATEALNQPPTPFAPYPAWAAARLNPHPVMANYPAAAYMTSALYRGARSPFQVLLDPKREEAIALQGLGSDNSGLALGMAGVVLAAVVAMAGVSLYATYQVGKAMAPDEDAEVKYGLGGMGLGLVAGFVGLSAPVGLAGLAALSTFGKD